MNRDANLVITGFMGTGKSAVGRLVAERLGRQFVDTDQLIEARIGRSVPEIFQRDGEAAFRALEAEVCRELSHPRGLVVATGGWALGTAENRAAMEAGGVVVCLRAGPSTLIERLGSAHGRPMLQHSDWRARLEALLTKRLPVYLSFPLQVNASRMTAGEAADRVIALWEAFGGQAMPHALPVMAGDDSYSVLIGAGLLDRAGPLVAGLGRWSSVVQVSDETVGALYGDRLAAQARCAMPVGEAHKTLSTVSDLYAQFLRAGLDRSGVVLALGGGVVGDVVGFAAATFMRGVALVQLPTTLLAMVDSSVGGKTGVDLPQGKNLVGAFKQPALVIVDPTVLATLPEADLRAGLAEVVKAGVIGAPALFERLEQGRLDDVAWLIRAAVEVKIAVVEEDPFERGRRAVLNLGHTFGHAFEVLSDYRLRHGEAVAMGMVAAVRLAVALGRCGSPPSASSGQALLSQGGGLEIEQRLTAALARLGLPTETPDYAPDAVWAAMASDKKKQGGRLRFVLPVEIGRVEICDDVPKEVVMQVLRQS